MPRHYTSVRARPARRFEAMRSVMTAYKSLSWRPSACRSNLVTFEESIFWRPGRGAGAKTSAARPDLRCSMVLSPEVRGPTALVVEDEALISLALEETL